MFELFEHKADIGVRGVGETDREAFEECAKAMFSVMTKLESVKGKNKVEVEVRASDLNALLVAWLNELLYMKDAHEMLFSKFEVKEIRQSGENFELTGVAAGEKLDAEKHELKIEVKAATYSGLKVFEENGRWTAQCIADV